MENKKKKREVFKRKLMDLLGSSSEDESEVPPPKQRRRIILSSDEENTPPLPTKNKVTPSLLEKIGHVQKIQHTFTLHEDIKSIWEDVLKKGLNKDVKDSIVKNIPDIKDCFTSAPLLNPEIKVTLSPQATKRDEHLCAKQTQIGASICGLSHILQNMLDGKDFDDTTIEKLSNYIRLLCDVHHMESETRRAVILPGLNKNLKESVEKTDINQNLFGRNLSDIIREARTLEKSKKDLTKERSLNNWGPSGVRKQGGHLNYKRPYHQPPTKQTMYNRQRQQRQQFRAMVKQPKELSRRAPADHRRRRD